MKLVTPPQFNGETQLSDVNVECDYFDMTSDVGIRIWAEPGIDLSIILTESEWAALVRASVTPASQRSYPDLAGID